MDLCYAQAAVNMLANVDIYIGPFGIINSSLAPDILGGSVLACTLDL